MQRARRAPGAVAARAHQSWDWRAAAGASTGALVDNRAHERGREPPSPLRGSRSQTPRPARGGDFYLATAGTCTWPPAGTFSWPRTPLDGRKGGLYVQASEVSAPAVLEPRGRHEGMIRAVAVSPRPRRKRPPPQPRADGLRLRRQSPTSLPCSAVHAEVRSRRAEVMEEGPVPRDDSGLPARRSAGGPAAHEGRLMLEACRPPS
jgi:hypothetical protein